MTIDPIVEEIHQIRQSHAAKFQFDLRAIFLDLQERQKSSGRTYVSLTPRRDNTDQDRLLRRGREVMEKARANCAGIPEETLNREIDEAIEFVRQQKKTTEQTNAARANQKSDVGQ